MIVREFSVPVSFTVGEYDNIVSPVFSHERDDPDHVIFQRLVDGVWTDVTCKEAAEQIRAAALGLIAEGWRPETEWRFCRRPATSGQSWTTQSSRWAR